MDHALTEKFETTDESNLSVLILVVMDHALTVKSIQTFGDFML